MSAFFCIYNLISFCLSQFYLEIILIKRVYCIKQSNFVVFIILLSQNLYTKHNY